MKVGKGSFTRREMLASAAAAAGAWSMHSAAVAAPPALIKSTRGRMPPAELKKRIRGPIVSIPTPFTRDFEVDYQGVRSIVELGLGHGIVAFELTSGDSRYASLTYEEIKELTRVLAETVGDRGIAIGATGAWWTGQTIDYVRYAESVGVHGVQVLRPHGYDEGWIEHYHKVAKTTSLGIILHGKMDLKVLERLAEIESIVGMKEDSEERYFFDIQRKFGDRLAIFCGGQKWRFLIGHRYGAKGYLSVYATIFPEIANRFWRALENQDLDQAREIVLKYDQPMFDYCKADGRPFTSYWHAGLEHFGVTGRWLRPPEKSCTDEELADLGDFYDGLGLKARSKT